MKEIVYPYVLKNAYDFQGKANANAVLGMILRQHPQLKKNVPEVIKTIEKLSKDIAVLSKEEIQKKLEALGPSFLEEKKETMQGPLKPLPNAQPGKFVARIAPSPSGPLHIGHAYGTSLNYEYAKMYNGRFLLRIEDTNAENIYPPAYDLIVDDVAWLTEQGVSDVVIQSSRLGRYYDSAEKLITLGKAYVCTCDADRWTELKKQGISCPCRDMLIPEQQQRYAKLFAEYAEGEAVVRLKTDIAHKNPAMRDFGIMRIVEHVHPMTGKEQKVWPLMIFSVAVDDHEMGITHVLNGKDHADNAIKEQIIMNYLGWAPPTYKHWGRINFEGYELSTSKTRRAIEEGKYSGWDDIRLPFLRALRRRGYQPQAFRRFALEMGLSLNDKTVSWDEFWKSINSFNRDIIEPVANRYFFVRDAVKIKIIGAPKKEVKLDLHPSFPERGKRVLMTKAEGFIQEEDMGRLEEGKIHRLMDYCNFEAKGGKFHFLSESYEEYKNAQNRGLIIHWLAEDGNTIVEVLLQDNTKALGLGERAMQQLKAGDIVQLERQFYARVDAVEKHKITFWYLHT